MKPNVACESVIDSFGLFSPILSGSLWLSTLNREYDHQRTTADQLLYRSWTILSTAETLTRCWYGRVCNASMNV